MRKLTGVSAGDAWKVQTKKKPIRSSKEFRAEAQKHEDARRQEGYDRLHPDIAAKRKQQEEERLAPKSAFELRMEEMMQESPSPKTTASVPKPTRST